MTRKILPCTAVLFLFAACATPPPQGPMIDDTSFTYSVGAKAHHELEKIAEKPELRLGLYTQVGYSVTIRLAAINEMSTQVKITADIEAYDTNVTKKWQPCKSKGVIERELLEKIRDSL